MTLDVKDSPWYILYKNKTNYDFLIKVLKKEQVNYYSPTFFIGENDKEQVEEKEYESIKNLIFIQPICSIHGLFNRVESEYGIRPIPYNDCMTGDVACVCDTDMQRFIKLCSAEPQSVKLLKDRFEKFNDRPHVRVKSGPYEGLDGRLVRIRRDRKVVISLGSSAVSVSGIHFSQLEFK